MPRTQLTPLRSTVGDLVPITAISVVARAPDIAANEVTAAVRASFAEIQQEPLYARLLPARLDLPGGPLDRDPQVLSFPQPGDVPVALGAGCASIFVVGKPVGAADLSRRLWIDLELQLRDDPAADDADQPVPPRVGGVGYAGHPYLPQIAEPEGYTSANWGLPRELRVTWDGQAGDGFLDEDPSLTVQQPLAHSGLQIVPFGPISTRRLRLRLGDFPKLLTRTILTGGTTRLVQVWGIAIPYLFAFRYEEQTRWAPRVPLGLLAATQTSAAPRTHAYVAPAAGAGGAQPTPEERARDAGMTPDLVIADGSSFVTFTAASALQATNRRRLFDVPGTQLGELFVSDVLAAGDEVRFYVAQAEEHARAVAGLRLTFGQKLAVPIAQGAVHAPLDVLVYELDPPPGALPTSTALRSAATLDADRYAVLLHRALKVDQTAADGPVALRFSRPSTARAFAIVFRAADRGQLALEAMELVQSAHVVVTPRPSRTRIVERLRYRIVGPDLASDYAMLGATGFSLVVERVAGGEPAEELFAAWSLLDLLQDGGARLYANHRRWLLEEETAQTRKGSYGVHEAAGRSSGWHRTESGDGVVDDPAWQGADGPDPSPDGRHGFRVLGNSESRAHTRHLGRMDPNFSSVVQSAFGLNLSTSSDDLIRAPGQATTPLQTWAPWNQPNAAVLGQLLRLNPLHNVNMPPFFGQIWSQLAPMLTGQSPPSPDLLEATVNPVLQELFLANGLSVAYSGNVSAVVVGAGFSLSASSSVPTLIQSATVGDSGAIVRQAHDTGYAYQQQRTAGFDRSRVRTNYPEGTMIRRVARSPVQRAAENRDSGAEVFWQGRPVDIVTGSIPLRVALPGTAGRTYGEPDQLIRVRLGRGPGSEAGKEDAERHIHVDLAFELREEVIRDDD